MNLSTVKELLENDFVCLALDALQDVKGFEREVRLLACFCAELSFYIEKSIAYPIDINKEAVNIAKKYAEGTCSKYAIKKAYHKVYQLGYKSEPTRKRNSHWESVLYSARASGECLKEKPNLRSILENTVISISLARGLNTIFFRFEIQDDIKKEILMLCKQGKNYKK